MLALEQGSLLETGEIVAFKVWPPWGAVGDPARHFRPDGRRLFEAGSAPPHREEEALGFAGPRIERPSGVRSKIPERPER